MTEAEWLACTNPAPTLDSVRGKTSDRKLRLFTCACCRHVWDHLATEEKEVVITVECCADGWADLEEERGALPKDHAPCQFEDWFDTCGYLWGSLRDELRSVNPNWPENETLEAIEREATWFPEILFLPDPVWTARITSRAMCRLVKETRKSASKRGSSQRFEADAWQARWDAVYAAEDAEMAWQSAVLSDLFLNVFQSVSIAPAWLSWKNGTVPTIARVMYDKGDFDAMPILADALEEAGCTNDDILRHCRLSGDHIRGCWLLDLLLGKE